MQLSSNVNAEEEQSQASAQFETACSDRIKQFDDSDSDEEVGGDGVDSGRGGGGDSGGYKDRIVVRVGRVWGEECGLSVRWRCG